MPHGWLASSTEVCAALSDYRTADNRPATGAGVAIPPEDVEMVGVGATSAGNAVKIGAPVAERGATMGYGIGEDRDDSRMQRLDFSGSKGVGRTLGVNFRLPESFIDVDVAEAGNDGLGEKEGFDGA